MGPDGNPKLSPRRLTPALPIPSLSGMGTLYYGDNLDILRRYLPDAAVDLVYLDPQTATDAQLPNRWGAC